MLIELLSIALEYTEMYNVHRIDDYVYSTVSLESQFGLNIVEF